MEQSANSLDDTSEYLCGICPLSFPRNALVRHITEHLEVPGRSHAHYLWCNLCSPLLPLLNVSANNDHPDYHENFGSRRGAREEGIAVNGYNPTLVYDSNPSISTVTSEFNCSMNPANEEISLLNGSFEADTWDEVYYAGTYILPFLNSNTLNYPPVNNDLSTLNSPRFCRDPTNNSLSNPSINIVPLFSPTNAEIFSEDVTYPQSLSEMSNATISCYGYATYNQHLAEKASVEIPRKRYVTWVEPLPETPNAEIPCSGQSAHIEPLQETPNAEIPYSGQSAHIEPLPETPNAEIPYSGQSTHGEPLRETTNAEIPCSGQSVHIESLPETSNAEMPCIGESEHIKHLQETDHSETYYSEHSPFVKFRSQATDSESHSSESRYGKFRAGVCHSSSRQKGPNNGSSVDTLNVSGPKASSANSHGSGSDNTRKNPIISSVSLKGSNGNLSYSEALKRGLTNRR